MEIVQVIEDLEKKFVDLFNWHDAPGLVDMYTRDAQILPPNMGAVAGRKALEDLFRGFWSEGFTVMKLETLEVQGSGGIAYEVGTYKLSGKREKDETDQGKYIVIWKEEDGQWKLHRDIFNTDLPAPKVTKHIEVGTVVMQVTCG